MIPDELIDGPEALPVDLRRRLAPLRELLHSDRRNAVVPFVGSGLSRGLPSWEALLTGLVSFAPEGERAGLVADISERRFIEVADHLEGLSEVGIARIQEAIVRAYERPAGAPPAVYEAVAALPTVHFITTNYDPWLKDAVSGHLRCTANVLLPTDGAILGHLDRPMPWVFHLHGDAAKPETCVLTANAYRRLLSGQPAWRSAVKTLLGSRHLLFLGSSLSEPHLSVLLGEFREDFQPQGGLRRHWWLGRPERSTQVTQLQGLGLEVVDYQDHGQLPVLLRWLAEPPGSARVSAAANVASTPTPPPTPAMITEFDPTRPWFFVPFAAKGEAMIGRAEALARVQAQLAAGRPTAIGHAAAFSGIGGIGKTQLAVEYCHEHREEYPGGVYWFTADQDIETQVLQLVDQACWLHPSTEHAVKLEVALHRLRSVRGALFVYDNVERVVSAADLKPTSGQNCSVLITSRLEQEAFRRVEIDLLGPEQALNLLLSEAGRTPEGPSEEAAAVEICQHLDGLPLAIELAGAYLGRMRSRSFAEYADLLQRKGLEVTVRAQPRFGQRSATAHEGNLADTLRVTGPLLDEHPGLEVALDILAWSASASMSWSLLVHLAAPDDPDLLREGVDLAAALHVLRLERDAWHEGGPRFRMHRLVQEVRRRERPAQAAMDLVRQVVARLAEWFEGRRQDFKDLEVFEAEMDHLESWTLIADELQLDDARVRLRWLKAYPSYHRGEYVRSLTQLNDAVRASPSRTAIARALWANIQGDKEVLLNNLGRHADALPCGEEALSLRCEIHGSSSEEAALALDNIGHTYDGLDRPEEALKHRKQSLELRVELFTEKHFLTARSFGNVGSSYGKLGQHDLALLYKQKSLSIDLEVSEPNHPATATAYNNVGFSYLQRGLEGDLELALENLERGLELKRKVFGSRHPALCSSLDNLSALHIRNGNGQRALSLGEQALQIADGVWGDEHLDTAYACHAVGVACSKLKLYRRARDMHRRCYAIACAILGKRSGDAITALLNLIAASHDLGDRIEAYKLTEEALKVVPKTDARHAQVREFCKYPPPPGFRPLSSNTTPREEKNVKQAKGARKKR